MKPFEEWFSHVKIHALEKAVITEKNLLLDTTIAWFKRYHLFGMSPEAAVDEYTKPHVNEFAEDLDR